MGDIYWTGDLDDDCTAEWGDYMLRAECMDKATWWWKVYYRGDAVAELHLMARSGDEARTLAEAFAKSHAYQRLQGVVVMFHESIDKHAEPDPDRGDREWNEEFNEYHRGHVLFGGRMTPEEWRRFREAVAKENTR